MDREHIRGLEYSRDLRGNLTYKEDVFGIERWDYPWSADMPQSFSVALVHIVFSTKNRGPVKTTAGRVFAAFKTCFSSWRHT